MPDSILYHDANRKLQDSFRSRAIADRLEEKLARTRFTEDDRAYIESVFMFFLATADAEGRPDCSFKGGPRGFVRVTAPNEIVFPPAVIESPTSYRNPSVTASAVAASMRPLVSIDGPAMISSGWSNPSSNPTVYTQGACSSSPTAWIV